MNKRDNKENNNSETRTLWEWLQEEGLNTKSAMCYMGGSQAQYLEILHLFASETKKRQEELTVFLENENLKDYAILVHAVKSNSKSIGADSLYEQAYALELAAKRGDIAFVRENNDKFFFDWNMLVAGLSFIPQVGIVDDMVTINDTEDSIENGVYEDIGREENDESTNLSAIREKRGNCKEKHSINNVEQNNNHESIKGMKGIKKQLFNTELKEIIKLLEEFEIEDSNQILHNLLSQNPDSVQKKCIDKAIECIDSFEYDQAADTLRAYIEHK